MEYEKFYAKTRSINKTLVVTIPSHIVKYCGWQEGDTLKIMCKKKEEDDESQEGIKS